MAEQVWSGSEWVDAPPVVAVGAVAASGKVWDGGFWVDPKSPSAFPLVPQWFPLPSRRLARGLV